MAKPPSNRKKLTSASSNDDSHQITKTLKKTQLQQQSPLLLLKFQS